PRGGFAPRPSPPPRAAAAALDDAGAGGPDVRQLQSPLPVPPHGAGDRRALRERGLRGRQGRHAPQRGPAHAGGFGDAEGGGESGGGTDRGGTGAATEPDGGVGRRDRGNQGRGQPDGRPLLSSYVRHNADIRRHNGPSPIDELP